MSRRPMLPAATGHPGPAVLSAAATLLVLVGGWTLAAGLQPAGFDAAGESISALAALDTPRRWVMTAALLLTGAGHLTTALLLGPARDAGRRALAAAGAATVATALLPLPSRTEGSVAHVLVAASSFLLLAGWPVLAARRDGPRVLSPAVSYAVTTVLTGLVLALPLALRDDTGGTYERVVAGALAAWPLVAAAGCWWEGGHRLGSRTGRLVAGAALLTLAGAVGGIATTTLAPVTVETSHYSARLSLSPDPAHVSRLTATTVFGDVTVRFTGAAPGIDASPQVKASITDVLGGSHVGLSSLQPSAEEIDSAVRDAGRELGKRCAAGAFLTILVIVLGYAVARPRDADSRTLSPRHVLAGLAAWLAAVLLVGSTMWTTYQSGRQREIATTGVLSTIQSNRRLLADVEQRSQDVAPYVRNLIALSSAMREKYAPTTLTEPVVLRVLLVSDLHGGNSYALVRSIVEEEDIDLVVDSGDLVTLGTVTEASAAGMFKGIASLGVPYVFVRGNHDAASATDTALLDRLARIPNVLLLQRGPKDYLEVEQSGIRIAGFNDPRWFGDSGTRTAAAQAPARRAFVDTYAALPAPDVVVSHEPAAVRGLDSQLEGIGVVVNGHMHSADLEGNRIQVGTLTGGGPLSHFLDTDGGGELVGQPSAFDIATFGSSCRLTSLTRYQFRNVIEGRPAYDDVTLVNGARIDGRPGDPSRTCARTATPTLARHPLVVPGESAGP